MQGRQTSSVYAKYHVARNQYAATSGDQIGRPYIVLMFSHNFLGCTEGTEKIINYLFKHDDDERLAMRCWRPRPILGYRI